MKYEDNGKILDLFVSLNNDISRSNRNNIRLDNLGIIGDKFYGKNIDRSILITSIFSYKIANDNSIKIKYGDLGENIILDIDITKLIPNDKIKIDSTLLQITQNCTICNGLSKIDPRLPTLLLHNRGIFAKVITGSQINKYDKIKIIKQEDK